MPRPIERPPIRDRLRLIREATGMTQTAFAAKLDALSVARFGATARRYTPPTISKIETGAQKADFDDVEVWAALDPLKRGKLWLAWNEDVDQSRRVPSLEELSAATGARAGATRRSAESELAAQTAKKTGRRRA